MNYFDVEYPNVLYCPMNTYNFETSVIIKNDSDNPKNLKLKIKQIKDHRFSLSKDEITIEKNSSEKIIINVSYPEKIYGYPGPIFFIKLKVSDKNNSTEYVTKIIIDRARKPIVDTTAKYDDKTKTATLYTKIDWFLFKPGFIDIDWGDGTITENVDSFPQKHKYSSDGVFPITVIAHCKKRDDSRYRLIGDGFVTIYVGNKDEYPDLNNLKAKVNGTKASLTCDVDWKKFESSLDLYIRWDDVKRYAPSNDTGNLLKELDLTYDYCRHSHKPIIEHKIIYILLVSNDKILKTYRLDVDIDHK